MSAIYLAKIGEHIINVGDISVVAPGREDMMPAADYPATGVRVTFRSKGHSLFVPDITPERFMDQLISGSIRVPD